MTLQATQLDDQELLHLAMEASAKERHADAIEYLKRASQSGKNAYAHFLLAAEYAQIGLNDRAVEEFRAALKIQPALHPARFQLGLLFMVNGVIQEALDTWKPLESSPDAEPYATFARGLASLAREDFAGAAENLRRGMEMTRANAPLNADMKRVLERVTAQIKNSAPLHNAPNATGDADHYLLSAYTRRLN